MRLQNVTVDVRVLRARHPVLTMGVVCLRVMGIEIAKAVEMKPIVSQAVEKTVNLPVPTRHACLWLADVMANQIARTEVMSWGARKKAAQTVNFAVMTIDACPVLGCVMGTTIAKMERMRTMLHFHFPETQLDPCCAEAGQSVRRLVLLRDAVRP